MVDQAHFIVIDIGKTLSKVTAWTCDGQIIHRQVRKNDRHAVAGALRLDCHAIAEWLREALAQYRGHPIQAIIPVAHGAGFAALGCGGLLFPPLDYEQPIPPAILADYRARRDAFDETGSPALPAGLNLGAQLWWAERLHPDEMKVARLVPWAQYWTWWLTGEMASEVTSLGCHTDLWRPDRMCYSPLALEAGWAGKFAHLMKAGDVAGSIRLNLAEEIGLSEHTPVLVGLHDSNAALLAARGFAEIEADEATVLSTGTWFVAMRLTREAVYLASLSEERDVLVNVDSDGRPVPSARFMGGREIESEIMLDARSIDIELDQPSLLEAVPQLLERRTMMLPTLAPGFGPFPYCTSRWLNIPKDWDERSYSHRAALCLYAALVADCSLDLIGSKGRIIVEGRFAAAEVFVRALASLRPKTEVFVANMRNDVSFGALRLIKPSLLPLGGLRRVQPLDGDIESYKAMWYVEMAGVPA